MTIANGCIIGAKCDLDTSEILQDNTVIFGPNNQRRIANEKPQVIFKIQKIHFRTTINSLFFNIKEPTSAT